MRIGSSRRPHRAPTGPERRRMAVGPRGRRASSWRTSDEHGTLAQARATFPDSAGWKGILKARQRAPGISGPRGSTLALSLKPTRWGESSAQPSHPTDGDREGSNAGLGPVHPLLQEPDAGDPRDDPTEDERDAQQDRSSDQQRHPREDQESGEDPHRDPSHRRHRTRPMSPRGRLDPTRDDPSGGRSPCPGFGHRD